MLKKVIRNSRIFIAIALVFSMALPVYATTADKQEKQEREENVKSLESEKEALQAKINDLKANKSNTESYMAELDVQLEDVQSQVNTKNQEIATTEADLEVTREELATAQKKEEHQYETLKKRIKVMYENGETDYMEVLLNAGDMSELLNGAEYISKISDYDSNLLQSLQETRQLVAEYEAELESQLAELETLKAELESKQSKLQIVLDAKSEELLALNSTINTTEEDLEDAMAAIEAEEAAIAQIDAAIAAAEAEAARKQAEAEAAAKAAAEAEAAQRAAAAAASTGSTNSPASSGSTGSSNESGSSGSNGGNGSTGNAGSAAAQEVSAGTASSAGMIWPVSGYSSISSSFGYRIHPIYGYQKFHSGIDIPAAAGTPVRAAASGTVIAASYDSSMGNYVIISHGNGVSTIYMHNSSVYVSAGQAVSQGDTISGVGTTGSSTGNHLHFSVKANGSYVNPLNYVSP